MLISLKPSIKETVITPTHSKFEFGPLEPGFGYTIGNTLRRTLLSSIPGAGITYINIEGVAHEFSTIPGVSEDVTELILNIKEVVVSSDLDEPIIASITKKGAGEILAGDIVVPTGVQIHNPDLHLATTDAKANVKIYLTIERGRGYISAEDKKDQYDEIGNISVDTIYSPVLRVAYKVEATRVEQRTDFDKLTLDVETKPSISPKTAMASAASTLVGLFGIVNELDENAEGIEIGTEEQIAEQVEIENNQSIDILELPQGSKNSLRQNGIDTINDLIAHTFTDLSQMKGMGAKKIEQVVDALAAEGLTLKPEA